MNDTEQIIPNDTRAFYENVNQVVIQLVENVKGRPTSRT